MNYKTYTVFATALLLLAAAGLTSYRAHEAALESGRLVEHTYEVIGELEGLHATVLEAESSRRAFVLTGDEAMLQPYHQAMTQLGPAVDRLRSLTADNPSQQSRIQGLRPRIAAKLEQLAASIKIQREQGFVFSAQEQSTRRGVALTSAVRSEIAAMSQEEHRLLALRSAMAGRNANNALLSIVTGAGVALLLALLAILRILADLRVREVAERKLQASEERTRLLLESTAEAIYGVDLEGYCTFCNPASVKMLGYQSASDLLGHNMDDLVHRARPSRILTAIQHGEGLHLDNEVFWRADSSSFPVDCWSNPIFREGVLIGAVITFVDLTERRVVERMKNEFVSVVSHKLRTPLTSLRGGLGLLAGGMLSTQPEKGQRILDIAVTNTDRLIRTIDDLDLERLASGKSALQMQACAPTDLMCRALETMQPMAGGARVTLACSVSESAQSIQILADADRVLQVLINLLSNAIKYSEPGGSVILSASSDERNITFLVSDGGCGFSEDKVEGTQGAGLGLPISRAIARQHGGRIWAESAVGKGSDFYFEIPVGMENPAHGVLV